MTDAANTDQVQAINTDQVPAITTDQVPVVTTSQVQVLTAEQVAAKATEIKAKFDNKIDVKETSFFFRKQKDEKTGIESKRATVVIPLPYLSIEGIVDVLTVGMDQPKQLEMLVEAVNEVITAQARSLVNDDENINADNFPYDKVTWEFIANLPKADRRGGGISKEVWEDFEKDYIAVMPAAANKNIEQVTKAASLFITKFSTCKTDKRVLKVLQAQLAIYTNASPRAEDFVQCIEFLNNKLETLLTTDESALLNNL